MIISTNAIVLRTINYSDTSIIANLFSKNKGKITLIAKGARKPKSQFAGQLEPMNILNINYFHKDTRNIQLLKNSSYIANSIEIRENFESLNFGLTIVDILDKLLHENDIDPILYRLYKQTFIQLKRMKINPNIIFSFFLIQLSIRLGFKPELTKCSNCSKILDSANFDEHNGHLNCSNCSNKGTINFDKSTIKILQLLLITHIESLEEIEFNKENLIEIHSFLISYFQFHLEGISKIKSLKLLRKLIDG